MTELYWANKVKVAKTTKSNLQDELEYLEDNIDAGNISSFIGLDDTPNVYNASKILNSNQSSIVFSPFNIGLLSNISLNSNSITTNSNNITSLSIDVQANDTDIDNLSSLQDDYLLLDGTRAMIGNLDVGTHLIKAQEIKRYADDDYFAIRGGTSNAAAITVNGKNEGVLPGTILGMVPNAAKSALVTAFVIEGVTDTPKLKTYFGFQTNTISERSAGSGVTIDGCLIKDGNAADSNKLEASTKAQVQDHTPKAHTLASHSSKVHSELTGIGSSDHHTLYSHPSARQCTTGDWTWGSITGKPSNYPTNIANISDIPGTIANILTNHTKAVHDALGIAPASHGADKHTDRTRTIFVSSGSGFTTGELSSMNDFVIVKLDPSTDEKVEFVFQIPKDYVSGGTIKIIYLEPAANNGTVIWDLVARTKAIGEATHTDQSSDTGNSLAVGADRKIQSVTADGISLTYTVDDFVAIELLRDADNGSDNQGEDWWIAGILFEYTADQ